MGAASSNVHSEESGALRLGASSRDPVTGGAGLDGLAHDQGGLVKTCDPVGLDGFCARNPIPGTGEKHALCSFSLSSSGFDCCLGILQTY